jgi:hypothetical protein
MLRAGKRKRAAAAAAAAVAGNGRDGDDGCHSENAARGSNMAAGADRPLEGLTVAAPLTGRVPARKSANGASRRAGAKRQRLTEDGASAARSLGAAASSCSSSSVARRTRGSRGAAGGSNARGNVSSGDDSDTGTQSPEWAPDDFNELQQADNDVLAPGPPVPVAAAAAVAGSQQANMPSLLPTLRAAVKRVKEPVVKTPRRPLGVLDCMRIVSFGYGKAGSSWLQENLYYIRCVAALTLLFRTGQRERALRDAVLEDVYTTHARDPFGMAMVWRSRNKYVSENLGGLASGCTEFRLHAVRDNMRLCALFNLSVYLLAHEDGILAAIRSRRPGERLYLFPRIGPQKDVHWAERAGSSDALATFLTEATRELHIDAVSVGDLGRNSLAQQCAELGLGPLGVPPYIGRWPPNPRMGGSNTSQLESDRLSRLLSGLPEPALQTAPIIPTVSPYKTLGTSLLAAVANTPHGATLLESQWLRNFEYCRHVVAFALAEPVPRAGSPAVVEPMTVSEHGRHGIAVAAGAGAAALIAGAAVMAPAGAAASVAVAGAAAGLAGATLSHLAAPARAVDGARDAAAGGGAAAGAALAALGGLCTPPVFATAATHILGPGLAAVAGRAAFAVATSVGASAGGVFGSLLGNAVAAQRARERQSGRAPLSGDEATFALIARVRRELSLPPPPPAATGLVPDPLAY